MTKIPHGHKARLFMTDVSKHKRAKTTEHRQVALTILIASLIIFGLPIFLSLYGN